MAGDPYRPPKGRGARRGWHQNSSGRSLASLMGLPGNATYIHSSTAQRYDAAAGNRQPYQPQDYWEGDCFATSEDQEYAYVKQHQHREAAEINAIKEGQAADRSGGSKRSSGFRGHRGHHSRGRNKAPMGSWRDQPRSNSSGSVIGSTEAVRSPSTNTQHYPSIPKVDRAFKKTSGLAIYAVKDQITEALKQNQVVIIEGFTGCGKTTQVPQFILDDQIESGDSSTLRLVVTQPRRIAALSVATRVAQERNWEVGKIVGYQVGLSKNYGDETKIIYMTTGVLLQILINRKSLDGFSHIVIDEVHERDLDTDLLLLVIKKLILQNQDLSTKIVLMSATLNVKKFANYFPNFTADAGSGAALVKVPQAITYKVTEKYLNNLKLPQEEQSSDNFYDEPKIHPMVYEHAVHLIVGFDMLELKEHKAKPGKDLSDEASPVRGAVLVFLPGLLEIETMEKALNDYSNSLRSDKDAPDKMKWLIHPLHSTITTEEQQVVFRVVPKESRKIILATNIAESSITVTDIKYVIDFCLTKSLSCDPTTNYTCLRLEWASKNQCIQRKGRCGRVSDGVVFRMVPQQFYNKLVQEAPPEMAKASLESVVLHVKTLEMGSPRSLLATAVDPPAESGIKRAVANLKEVGALTIENPEEEEEEEYDGVLTRLGVIMSKLPIDLRFGRLIMIGYAFGLLEEAIIIASGMSTKSPFSHFYHRRLQTYLSKLDWAKDSCSDAFALINVYREYKSKKSKGDFNSPFGRNDAAKLWGKDYLVQVNVMTEISQLADEITSRLEKLDIRFSNNVCENDLTEDERILLKVVIAGAFYPNFFTHSRGKVCDYHREIQKELVGRSPFNTVVYQGFPSDHPGKLYSKFIAVNYEKDLECWPTVPYVQPESSKLLVSFDPRGHKVGLVCHGVYRAIKMRLLRQVVSFPIQAKHDAMSLADKMEIMQLSQTRNRCPPQVALPSITTKSVSVRVMKVVNPTEFYVMYDSDFDGFEEVTAELGIVDKENQFRTHTPGRVHKGDLVFVKSEDKIKRFLRGRVDLVTDTGLLIYHIDEGGLGFYKPKTVLLASKQQAPLSFSKPALAIQCRLKCVKPAARCDTKWAEQSINYMKSLIEVTGFNSREFEIFSIFDGVMCGDFKRLKGNQSLVDLLIEQGFVEQGKESRESEENNTNRNCTYFARQGASVHQIFEKSQKCSREPLPEYHLPTNQPKEKTVTVTLRGPTSPLEMSFHALCRSSHLKQVSVDGSSVNSVAIDQDYLQPCSRLLVAGSVGIAHRSGNVLARDTTLMPPIPGIAALMTMIFCPVLEFRSDESKTRYTGLLAGLGLNKKTGESMYGDHDIEIIFDTNISDEDIGLVNRIRQQMNALMEPNPPPQGDWTRNARQNLREFVMTLLTTKREPMEEVWPDSLHKWNCLDSYMVVPPAKPSNYSRDTVVFPAHSAINFKAVAP